MLQHSLDCCLHCLIILCGFLIGHSNIFQNLRVDLQRGGQHTQRLLLGQHDLHHLQAGQDAVTGAGVLREDDVAALLAKKKINVDIILQSIGRNSSKDISFTVARSDAEEARAILEENREYIGFQSIEVNTQVAKVSIVGAGMVNNSGVACKMFEALSSAGINISMISTSEIKVSVLVDERDADRAVQAIHDRFFSEFGNS